LSEEWIKRIIDELTTNKFEQRYTPYKPISEDEFKKVYKYLDDYLYLVMFGNEPLNKILSSELFYFILSRFDGRAKATHGWRSKVNEFLT
jgi:hypothetical protein